MLAQRNIASPISLEDIVRLTMTDRGSSLALLISDATIGERNMFFIDDYGLRARLRCYRASEASHAQPVRFGNDAQMLADLLIEVWRLEMLAVPDYRLGQLLANVAGEAGYRSFRECPDEGLYLALLARMERQEAALVG